MCASAIDFVLLFCVPFVIVVACYQRVIKHLNKKKNEAQDLVKGAGGGQDVAYDSSTAGQNKIAQGHKRGMRMLIVVVVLFTVCYSLPYIFKLYVFFSNVNLLMSNFAEAERWVYWISYTNPWLNLFAYVIFRDDVKEGLNDLFCRRPTTVQPSPLPTPQASLGDVRKTKDKVMLVNHM